MWGMLAALSSFRRGAEPTTVTVTRSAAPGDTARKRAPPGAALRAFEAHPHLRPASLERDDIEMWLAVYGGGDDGEDLLALAELSGWPIAESVAEVAVVALPAPAKPAKPVAVKPARVAPAPAVLPGRLELTASRAAEAFVAWMRMTGRTGTYKSKALTKLYQEHCRADDVVELHENVLRPALQQLPGVKKSQDNKLVATKHGGTHRKRAFLWTIEPSLSVSDDIPWQDLREAA